jgi:ATP-dependent helicase HrpA
VSAATEARAAARRLPIWDRADELRALITEHQVVIVAGETGSGKSTQLPSSASKPAGVSTG